MMASITFSSDPQRDAITIEADEDVGRKLLAVARERGIPILFTCAAGACGACLVEITRVAGVADLSAPPREEEAMLLQAQGKRLPIPNASGGTFRLACQYLVPNAVIVVRYPSTIGLT